MTTLMRSRSRLFLAALALVLTVTTLPRMAEAAPSTPLPIDEGQCWILPPGFDMQGESMSFTVVPCDQTMVATDTAGAYAFVPFDHTVKSQALEMIKIVWGVALHSALTDAEWEQDPTMKIAWMYYCPAGNTTNPAFAKAVAARARYAANAFLKGNHPLALNVMSSIQNALGTQLWGSMTTSDGYNLRTHTDHAVKYLQYLVANPTS